MLVRFTIRRARQSERGYVLLTLILFVALLAIAAAVTAPVIAFQLKRDREDELIHRGTQYSRAIQHYVKKFGSYPTSLEALENTNQVRMLRRRYKDPITGKDFKLLHAGEVQMSFGGGGIPGANSVSNLTPGAPGGLNAGGPGNGGFGNQGGFGVQGGVGPNGPVGVGLGGAGVANSQFGQTPGGTPNADGTNAAGAQAGQTGDNEGDSSAPAGVANTAAGAAANGGPGAPGTASNAFGANNQVFGGGPIVGVISTSKDKTIRVFSKKDHYNLWQFIYDPTLDMGGLITTPYQTAIGGTAPNVNGQQPGTNPNGQPGANPNQNNPNNPAGAQPNNPGNSNPGNTQTPLMPPEQNQNEE